MQRRRFLQIAAETCGSTWMIGAKADPERKPNVVFVFADQWRAQAAGYAGDPNVKTPRLDALAGESVDFVNAVANCPVCSPFRASLITGQYPLTHGVFLNDVHLRDDAVSMAEAYRDAGYRTAYIGKWHLDGHGRSNYIPRERRQGFEYWKVLECTHAYNRSPYYADADAPLMWDGYDAIAQTRDARQYIEQADPETPFLLVLSWGPPHNPYETAPEQYHRMYDPAALQLRPNVPENHTEAARKDLAGYYAHCTALDGCLGEILDTLDARGIADNTLFVFTSDHGDMLGSQGEIRKQRPWDESVRIPFLLRYPARLGHRPRRIEEPIATPDILPTLLGLCGAEIPSSVEGDDLAPLILGQREEKDTGALIACYTPFGEWTRSKGGREYRGVRTARNTYVRAIDGPWLLYDNKTDPFQQNNLCNNPDHAEVQRRLEKTLQERLEATHDEFLPGERHVQQWNYATDASGTVPYTP